MNLPEPPTAGRGREKSAEYAVFGGTFDPVHAGHISAARFLLTRFARVVLAPTAQNPWKKPPEASFQQRIEMLQLVLSAEELPWSSDPAKARVWIADHPYIYAADFVTYCRAQLPGNLHWAVGEDSSSDVSRWRNWPELGVPLVTVPVRINVHASEIRSGSKLLHPALKDYVSSHGLYTGAAGRS